MDWQGRVGVSSQLGCTSESPGRLLKLPVPRPNPGPVTSESLGVGPRQEDFLKTLFLCPCPAVETNRGSQVESWEYTCIPAAYPGLILALADPHTLSRTHTWA